MAEAAHSAERACVECGTNFVPIPQPGRPRKRCFECVPARKSIPKAGPPQERRTTCKDCGHELIAGTRGGMPTRCRPCYATHRRAYSRGRYKPRMAAYTGRRRTASLERRTGTCEGCGKVFVAKNTNRLKYCTRECAFQHRRGDKITDAARAALASGHQRKRWPFSRVTCGDCRHCKAPFVARTHTVFCEQHRDGEVRRKAELAMRPERQCPECQAVFKPTHGARLYCSEACGNRVARRVRRHKDRARLRLVKVERVDPIKVFERDGWRCQECRKPTPRSRRGTYHPRAPELDHIVPLSKGGEHSYLNTQCLCRECNLRKGDGPGGQLRLIA